MIFGKTVLLSESEDKITRPIIAIVPSIGTVASITQTYGKVVEVIAIGQVGLHPNRQVLLMVSNMTLIMMVLMTIIIIT